MTAQGLQRISAMGRSLLAAAAIVPAVCMLCVFAVGDAQAQREAMLAYLDDASSKLHPYPAFWAPFSIVG